MEKIHIWQQTKKWLDLSNTPFNKHHFSYWSIEIEKKKNEKKKNMKRKDRLFEAFENICPNSYGLW